MWVRADGETLSRPAVTVPGRTIPSGQAVSVPSVALPEGAVVLPSSQEYASFPPGHRVGVHHQLFHRDTYQFLPDHGASHPGREQRQRRGLHRLLSERSARPDLGPT